MQERPLSDRRQHEPGAVPWEIRAWSEPSGRGRDERGWRSVGWSAEHDDAVALARALVTAPDRGYEYAEVRGPCATPGHQACERFPEPDAAERREMWMRAATEHFSDGLDRQRASSL